MEGINAEENVYTKHISYEVNPKKCNFKRIFQAAFLVTLGI